MLFFMVFRFLQPNAAEATFNPLGERGNSRVFLQGYACLWEVKAKRGGEEDKSKGRVRGDGWVGPVTEGVVVG